MSTPKWHPDLIGSVRQQEAADEDAMDMTRNSRAHFYGLWPAEAQEAYLLIMHRFVTFDEKGFALFGWNHASWRHQ